MLSLTASAGRRLLSSSSSSARTLSIHEAVGARVGPMREELKSLKASHGSRPVGEVTVGMVLGGMRGIKGMMCDTSSLDAEEGIRFRGKTIPELRADLPKAANVANAQEPLPEGVLWLLLTGETPNAEQVASLSEELKSRAELPLAVGQMLDAFHPSTHAMTQLCGGVLAMQHQSKFAAAYSSGKMTKADMWETCLDDSLDIIAKLPSLAARIYANKYKGGAAVSVAEGSEDWAASYTRQLGFRDDKFTELMRLYMSIHADHEGGNASAHTTHLVGSTLADPYLSYSAGMAALAGPLHGLANQEVLAWTLKMVEAIGGADKATPESIEKYVWETLNAGQVVPGFGHAVLRKTDPRYTAQREFAQEHLPEDPLFKVVSAVYDVVPKVLTEHGKTANPWPNVDAHSGVLLHHYNLREADYYTVLFAVSRSIGVLSNLVLSRAVGLPIERPKSLTMEQLRAVGK